MKNAKKGFTLVELLVVIAIIAILATISIVSYVSFINRANMSVDQQVVDQMNKVFAADEIVAGKPATVVEAKNLLIANRLDDFSPIDERNVFYWVGSENRVVLWTKDEVGSETGKVSYPKEYAKQYKDVTTPSADWSDLNYEYSVVNVNAEEGKTLTEALLAALAEAGAGEPTYLVLPENSSLEFSQRDLIVFSNNLKSDSGVGKHISLDLNGSTISTPDSSYGVDIPTGGALEIVNGTWEFANTAYNAAGFYIGDGASFILRGVNLEIQAHTAIAPLDTASEVIIEDSTVLADANFGLSTNGMTSSHVRLVIKNSEIKNIVNGGGIGIMVNCSANVLIENSHIAAYAHALVMRAGHAEVINTTLETITTNAGIYKYDSFTHFNNVPKHNGAHVSGAPATYVWSQGNAVPGAVLVAGDYARETESYPGDVDVELINVTFKSASKAQVPFALVAAKMNKNVKVTYDGSTNLVSSDVIMYNYMIPEYFGSIVVNGESKTLD